MTAPLRHLPTPGSAVTVHALPEYEPTHGPGEEPPPRWSSLPPASGPQLTLVAPPREPDVPQSTLWRLLARILEVLEGRRAVAQLRALLSGPAYEAMLTRLRTTPAGRAHRLRRIRVCYPSPDAIELSAVLEIAALPPEPARVCAAAVRLERRGPNWLCSVFRVL